ncbi:MAG TPA: class I SAM-dependent methyltransferase [Thermoanaerobaculia bacterium]|nr:class I SAM-dependent methyltransferase [Thermoanaerobaculia bacterium]
MAAVTVPPLDPRLYGLLGEFPEALFGESFYRSWELVDRYAWEWGAQLVRDLGLEATLRRGATVDGILGAAGFVPQFRLPLEWLLRRLREGGVLAGSGMPARFGLRGDLPAARLAEVRRACLAVDPANAPALDLLDAAAAAYPAVAAGRVSGQEALFGLGQTRLWLDYFDNANPTYAINNRLAAIAAANRLPAGERWRILEVGGGAGSGSAALLEELAGRGALDRLAALHVTEPSPFFRRRAERTLRQAFSAAPLTFAGGDIDRPLAGQGVEPAAWHLVYGVNVLHVARDLVSSLGELRDALRPGGWLVAAEAIRPWAGKPISTELVFQLLEGFREVALDPELRPNPGFLTAEQWEALARAAGFATVEVVPDQRPIREIYPRFFTGVVCARR